MIDADKKEFSQLMTATMGIYQQECSPEVMRIWFAALSRFKLPQVSEAFSRHVQSPQAGKFAPKPADIIGMIELMNPDGRLGAEEAWSLYPHDESSSAVITNEMAEAMQVAQPLLNEGDKIGARMAFKEAYARIVAQNKFNGIAPKWFPSLGHSPEGREQALKEAVRLGRIGQAHVDGLLPAPVHPGVMKAIGDIKLLTTSEELTDEQKAKNHERIQQIKRELVKAA